MGSPVITTAAVLRCAHGAPASALPTSVRVRVAGAAVVCADDTIAVTACSAAPACGTLRLAASLRATASGRPLAIHGNAVSTGSGAPALALAPAARVLAR